jgi:hypothetical protein
MRLLGPIVRILRSIVNYVRYQFPADRDASFGQEVFDIAVAKVETVVQPDSIADDVGWKSMTLVCIHGQVLAVLAS